MGDTTRTTWALGRLGRYARVGFSVAGTTGSKYMECPNCGSRESAVKDSRSLKTTIRTILNKSSGDPNIRPSPSRCRSTRPIWMSPKTSRASSRRHESRKKSGQGFAPKPGSPLRPASSTTSSSPNSPRIIASRTGSSSLRLKWDRHSSRPCRSEVFTASGLRQPGR